MKKTLNFYVRCTVIQLIYLSNKYKRTRKNTESKSRSKGWQMVFNTMISFRWKFAGTIAVQSALCWCMISRSIWRTKTWRDGCENCGTMLIRISSLCWWETNLTWGIYAPFRQTRRKRSRRETASLSLKLLL